MSQQCHINICVKSASNCPVLLGKEMVETHKDFHDLSLLHKCVHETKR